MESRSKETREGLVSVVEPVVAPQRSSRRRFMGGAAGGVGVLLAVQAKSALGGVCQSPSAMVSGNMSAQQSPAPCDGGLSPGYWAQPQKRSDFEAAGLFWPTFNGGKPCVYKTGSTTICANGLGKYSLADVDPGSGTPVDDVLPGAQVTYGLSVWALIAFPSNPDFTDPNNVMRHLCAAWLNAGFVANYPISRIQIREMWDAIGPGFGGTYCPASLSSTCGANGMTAADIADYISGMYHTTVNGY